MATAPSLDIGRGRAQTEGAMPDDKPNPIEDVRKGLGLLFRAARGAVEKLPTKELEEVVVTSAREVGRALENVGKTIEREVTRVKDDLKPGGPPRTDDAPKAREDKEDTKDKPPEPPTGAA
jgi:hypothetical protein